MASGEFSKYNQAVLADDEQKQLKKARKSIDEAESQFTKQKSDFDKNLKLATFKNQDISRDKVVSAKKQLREQEQIISQADKQVSSSEKKFSKAKSVVETPEQLEKKGYKKEVRGNKVIYYKEDTYERREDDERSYREEEYIFNKKTKKPVKFVRRDEGRRENSDKEFVFDQRVVEFKNGAVRRVEEKEEFEGSDEYRRREFYDPQGRITDIRYYDDGQFEEEEEFRYDGGQVIVERDTAEAQAARRARIKAEDKFWKDYKKAYNQAKDQGIDIQIDGDKNQTLKQKADAFNEQYTEGLKEKREITEIRLKTDQETGVQTLKYKNKEGDILREVEKTPVNAPNFTTMEGESVYVSPQTRRVTQTNDVRSQLTDITLPVTEQQQRNQRQTITPQQLEERGKPVQGADVVFGFSAPGENEVNLNPARFFVAPYQAGGKIGDYLYETIDTRGSNVKQDVSAAKEFVVDEGIIGTGGALLVGTATAVAQDPFGFVGESVAGGGVVKGVRTASNSARRARTEVNPIDMDSRSVQIDTAGNRQGLGIESTQSRGRFEIRRGKNTEVVDVETSGLINKESRALGQRDPEYIVSRDVKNTLSREYSPADVLDGNIDVKVSGPKTRATTTARVDGIRQGDNQIINVDDQTFFSQTQKVGQLDTEDIFVTQTLNPKTQDVSVSTSKNVRQSNTDVPTQDLFTDGSISQTDVFYNRRDLMRPSPDRVVDTTASPRRIDLNKQTQSMDEFIASRSKPQTPRTQQPGVVDTTSRVQGEVPLSMEDFLKNQLGDDTQFDKVGASAAATSSSSSQPKFIDLQEPKKGSSGSQTQVFEEPKKAETSTTAISQAQKDITEYDNPFQSKSEAPTQVPISPQLVKKTIIPDTQFKPVPAVDFDQSPVNFQSQNFAQDQYPFEEQKKSPVQEPTFDTSFRSDQTPRRDVTFDFSFSSAQSPETKQTPSFDSPPSPQKPAPPVKPPVAPPNRPRLDLDFDFNKKSSKNKRFAFEALEDDGRYISSLGAAITGKTSKNPTQDITGLKVRAIQLNGRNKR